MLSLFRAESAASDNDLTMICAFGPQDTPSFVSNPIHLSDGSRMTLGGGGWKHNSSWSSMFKSVTRTNELDR